MDKLPALTNSNRSAVDPIIDSKIGSMVAPVSNVMLPSEMSVDAWPDAPLITGRYVDVPSTRASLI